MVIGNKLIRIIQGDTYQLNVSITDNSEMVSNIASVYLSCKGLNITQELEYNSELNKYIFSLFPEETIRLTPGNYDYDLTILFEDDNVYTTLYRAEFIVLPKVNEVNELEPV